MRLMHLSDLHLGKRLENYSLLEDQRYILAQVLNIIDREGPDAVLIAGDVYDRSVPSVEAVALFDRFLTDLAERKQKVFVISGNHDSPERLSFGGKLMEYSGIHISPVYQGNVIPYPLSDRYGTVNVYLLPFVKPVHVRRFFPEEEIASYTDAIRVAVEQMGIDKTQRNVLVAHQFVTGAVRSESEEITVGGLDNVDASVFDGFDYVALGHIHGPQNIAADRIRYCGTPLKYSFSESGQVKSVTMVDMGEKGDVKVRLVPLEPVKDLKQIRGTFDEVTSYKYYAGTTLQEDYLKVVLTDEDDIPDAMGKLRMIYHNIVKMEYDNTRTRHRAEIEAEEDVESKSPIMLFGELFEQQNGQPMTEEQQAYIAGLIEEIWEDER
ncbi:MAG: exonuclease SbcCD subunit D [Oscillospiraceae bacterium]|nr:exonuclease SbcCD subunit D [Oscillospiraceae bacterium]